MLFVTCTRAKVAACSHNPECLLAHNLGTPRECLIAQYNLTAQHNFVAYNRNSLAWHHFTAQHNFVADHRNSLAWHNFVAKYHDIDEYYFMGEYNEKHIEYITLFKLSSSTFLVA